MVEGKGKKLGKVRIRVRLRQREPTNESERVGGGA
jgi:hypothetical protein